MSDYTLQHPCDIEAEVGLHRNEINSFKGKGCRFYGRKTCVAWVREYLAKITATESSTEHVARRRRSSVNKSGELAATNG